MGKATIIIWLILLTAWVGFSEFLQHEHLQVRNSGTMYRNQKFEEVNAHFKSLEQYINGTLREELNEGNKYRNQKFEWIDGELKIIREYINGTLREELNGMKKYLHKH